MDVSGLFELYVVLWSEQQGAFHVETVAEMLRSNWDSYYRRKAAGFSDWILVGFADTREGAHTCIQRLKAGMDSPMRD